MLYFGSYDCQGDSLVARNLHSNVVCHEQTLLRKRRMTMSDLMLDVGLANEIKLAARRTGCTGAHLKWLTEGDNMSLVRQLADGTGEVVPKEPKWQVHEGTITLEVASDGTTGSDWIERLEAAGNRLSKYAKQVLRSHEFQPTNGVVYNVTILPGPMFSDEDRITKKIRLVALNRGLLAPNAELGCLLREYLTDEDIKQLGLWWLVVMHEPIEDSDGNPGLLSVRRRDGGQWLYTYSDDPDDGWFRGSGFVFVRPAS